MDTMWDKDRQDTPETTPPTNTEGQPTEPSSVESPVSASEQPASAPAEPTTPAPEAPSQPPVNGWSSDGSYRYVPPRAPQPPTQPSTQGSYPPPVNGGYGWPTQPTNPVHAQTSYGSPTTGGNGKPPKKGNGWIVAVAIIAAIAVVGCLVMAVMSAQQNGLLPNVSSPTASTDEDTVNTDRPTLEISAWDDDDGGLSNQEVVNRNFDATVVLTVYTQSASFNFGESALTEAGASSGIIMSEDGYIITNWHCVINEKTNKSYDRIDVTTYDGKTYHDAEVIGADESTDLAVIKIAATGLTAAEFGDSSALAVGDRVVALGNAAGLSWTATFGYVSALARDVYDDTGYALKCLQVDAAINYGNSGGPLLNNQGLVVGINSAKIAASGYEGLGFSIPINEAKTIIDSLMQHGRVKGRVALGITGQTVSSGMYNGFLIATIEDESCLKGTEARAGDLIVAVNDTTVTDYGTLRSALAKYQVGDAVKLKLLRSDRQTGQVSSLTVTVTLKEQTSD